MSDRFGEVKSVPLLIILNRQIELIPHVIDIPLNGFRGNLESFGEYRTVRSTLGLDCFVDEFHPSDRHSGRWKPGELGSNHNSLS